MFCFSTCFHGVRAASLTDMVPAMRRHAQRQLADSVRKSNPNGPLLTWFPGLASVRAVAKMSVACCYQIMVPATAQTRQLVLRQDILPPDSECWLCPASSANSSRTCSRCRGSRVTASPEAVSWPKSNAMMQGLVSGLLMRPLSTGIKATTVCQCGMAPSLQKLYVHCVLLFGSFPSPSFLAYTQATTAKRAPKPTAMQTTTSKQPVAKAGHAFGPVCFVAESEQHTMLQESRRIRPRKRMKKARLCRVLVSCWQ